MQVMATGETALGCLRAWLSLWKKAIQNGIFFILYYAAHIVLTVFKNKSRCIPGSGEI